MQTAESTALRGRTPPARLITGALRAQLLADDTPHGQLLTSRSKQPTYLPREGELAGFVWKGPYRPNSRKVAWVRFRTACFGALGTPACLATVVPDEAGTHWCCYPNLSPVPPEQWRLLRKEDRCLGKEVWLVDRSSLCCVRLSDCDLQTMRTVLFERTRLITAFLDAAVLYTGDAHPVNLLFNGTNCWLSDYEEVTTRSAIGKVADLFARAPRKQVLFMIEEGCRRIVPALEAHLLHLEDALPLIVDAAAELGIPALLQQQTGRAFQPEAVVTELKALVDALGERAGR